MYSPALRVVLGLLVAGCIQIERQAVPNAADAQNAQDVAENDGDASPGGDAKGLECSTSACDDATGDTPGDTLVPVCQPETCDDQDPCTADRCDPQGCLHVALSGWAQSPCLKAGLCADSPGTATCEGGVWACTYPVGFAAGELACDGVDEDCDGVTDDLVVAAPESCTGPGVCAGGAPGRCVGGAPACGWELLPRYEAVEVSCDYLDNDCNGVVDDGCDRDHDGVFDPFDHCPDNPDHAQADADGDGHGDACDVCPLDPLDDCVNTRLGWWPLDELTGPVYDLASQALPGDVGAGVQQGAPGARGRAVELPGNGARIVVAAPVVMDGLAMVTLQAFVRVPAVAVGVPRVAVALGDAATLGVDAKGYPTCGFVSMGPSPYTLVAGRGIADGEWHHVSCVRHLVLGTRYFLAVAVDGAVSRVAHDGNAAAALVSVDTVSIGAAADGTRGFLGGVDDVRVDLGVLDPESDFDGDAVPDVVDQCPGAFDPAQLDGDSDGVGDVCDDRVGISCAVDADCDEGSPCTADTCVQGRCARAPAQGACDDGIPATSPDLCDAGRCVGTRPTLTTTTTLLPGVHLFDTIDLTGNRTVTCLGDTNTYYGLGCRLFVRTATVGVGARLTADGQGHPQARGPGQCGGNVAGSHGGLGAALQASYCGVEQTYGDDQAPLELGSGSADADGGGAIAVYASEWIVVDGTLTADGALGNYGASGGSVLLVTPTLMGSGVVRARGGAGELASGGGGRVAVLGSSVGFSGTLDVSPGGSSVAVGAAGTVFTGPIQ